MYRRYMKLCPEDAEEFIDYLIKSDRLDEAAIKLGDIVNDEKFTSKEGKSKHQLWHDLCDLMTKNPDKVSRATQRLTSKFQPEFVFFFFAS